MKKKILHVVCMFIICCASVHFASAQEKVIIGKVTDSLGAPLSGATVHFDGVSQYSTTDDNGQYSLIVPSSGKKIVASYPGMVTQELEYNGQSELAFSLQPIKTSNLDEVIVVGYGTQKKSDLTGSVVAVKAAQLNQRPATNVEQMLAGRAAGVNISTNSGRPGGMTNVSIRGVTSVSTGNGPLYVVDGVIGVGNINYLNPNDIESIDVLKDASATAIYGARGASGVILITTKRGRRSGGQVNYDSYLSVNTMAKYLKVLNSDEFLKVEQASYSDATLQKFDPSGFASGKYTAHQNFLNSRSDTLFFDANGNPRYNTDWQKAATRSPLTQNHNLSFVGGSDKSTYGLFLNYANEQGIVMTSQLKRYSVRFVFDSQVKDWLKVGGTTTFNHIEDHRVDGAQGGLNVLRMMVEQLPITPIQWPNGVYGSNYYYPDMEGGANPVDIALHRTDIYKTQTNLGNVYTNITFSKNLQLRTNFGWDVDNIQEDFYSGRTLRNLSADQQGEADVYNTRNNYWQFENYLTYDKKWGIQSLNVMAGLSWQKFTYFYSSVGSQTFTDDFYLWNNIGAGSKPVNYGSNAYDWKMNSYFARINYSLNNKYLFTLTGRADGSSKFGENNKYGFFPSGAFAWKVSDEDFLKNNKVISNLKLRTSYGMIGNSEIPAYQSLAGLGSGNAILGGQRVSTVGVGTLANPNLKWEKTSQADIGFEIGLFQNRINIDADIYYKKTTDMLLSVPLDPSSGYTSVYKNIGDMENKGFELTINSVNIEAGNFKWNTTFNISINKNKVLKLGTDNGDVFPSPYFLSNTNIVRVGQPVGSFYGLVRTGTWGSNEADEAAKYGKKPGDVKLADLNGDGSINDGDRKIIGKGIPTGFGTLLNSFNYKNLDLVVELQYMYGNDLLNLSRHSGEDRTGQANSYATVLNGWTESNQNTMIAQNRPAQAGYTTNVDSHMVEDGSFIRGKNLMLGYTFPEKLVSKLKLSRLRVYASAQNFFLSTKFSGYDPEVTTYPGAPFAQGITFFDYPKPRTYMFGINVSF